jgi:hypothetical protein
MCWVLHGCCFTLQSTVRIFYNPLHAIFFVVNLSYLNLCFPFSSFTELRNGIAEWPCREFQICTVC